METLNTDRNFFYFKTVDDTKGDKKWIRVFYKFEFGSVFYADLYHKLSSAKWFLHSDPVAFDPKKLNDQHCTLIYNDENIISEVRKLFFRNGYYEKVFFDINGDVFIPEEGIIPKRVIGFL